MQLLLDDPIDTIMPLNEVDKAWIRLEIQTAHKRHGLLVAWDVSPGIGLVATTDD
jgi:hypothetical protein